MAAIHTVIKRLHDAGELRFVTASPGKNLYVWQRPAKAIAIGPEVAEFVRQQASGPGEVVPPRTRAGRGRKK
jgi:hypothetical protein